MEREPRPQVENEAETSEPIEPDAYGEIVEIAKGDDVDGDLNGALELAGLDESRKWTGVDALDAMRGGDADAVNRSDDAPLAERLELLEQERSELAERLEALRRELPERVIASEAEGEAADGGDSLSEAALLADELGRKLRRIQDAIARAIEESRSENVPG